MPESTIASAVASTSLALTSQWNVFQLFQPIGGVRAWPLSRAMAGETAKRDKDAARAITTSLCQETMNVFLLRGLS